MSKLSRRALVTSAAALPALAVPVVALAASAGPDDPIYAAIEAYRRTEAACFAMAVYEDEVKVPTPHQTPEMAALAEAAKKARRRLAQTSPATLPGLVAYLDYVVTESESLSSPEWPMFVFDDEEETLVFVRSLARSAHRMRAALAVQS
jgi:hypothetical protein